MEPQSSMPAVTVNEKLQRLPFIKKMEVVTVSSLLQITPQSLKKK